MFIFVALFFQASNFSFGLFDLGASILDVDLVDAFTLLGQDTHLIAEDLGETSNDEETSFLVSVPDHHLADVQFGQQRNVAREDAEFTIRPGKHDLIDLFGQHGPLRGDNFELEAF